MLGARPILPRPSARSVPRWRSDCPIVLRTCVIFTELTPRPPPRRGSTDASSGRAPPPARPAASSALGGPPDGTGAPRRCVLPRSCATSSGRTRRRRPSTVARVMLIGVVVPRLFASTSRIPASSSTARTPPPAMTPVPSLAGRRTTRAASNRPDDLVRDRLPVLRHGEQVLLRVLDGLRDGERDLARLAVAEADAVDLVADDDERGEREPPAALDDLGDAVDLDHALLQLARVGDFPGAQNWSPPSRAPSASALTRPWYR